MGFRREGEGEKAKGEGEVRPPLRDLLLSSPLHIQIYCPSPLRTAIVVMSQVEDMVRKSSNEYLPITLPEAKDGEMMVLLECRGPRPSKQVWTMHEQQIGCAVWPKDPTLLGKGRDGCRKDRNVTYISTSSQPLWSRG